MSQKSKLWRFHAGWRADPATGAVAVPIYQTTSYQFQSAEHAANLFALKELGNIYTRIMNPTNDVLEKRVAALEGGVAGLALASGQAASAFSIQNLARAGDNVVSSTDLYGGTWNLFANTMKDQGIEVRFVDPADPENFRKATDARTRAYYAETLPNPKLIAFPIEEVAAIGRPLGIPLIMDNTAAPILTRPFEHGAAVVVYSSTKYLGGHGTSIGGLIIDSGNFAGKSIRSVSPLLNTPDPSYHGAVWSEAVKPLGPSPTSSRRATTLLRDLGSAMSPFNAFLTLQGVETLPLRIERHSQTPPRSRPGSPSSPRGHERHPPLGSERRSQRARRKIPQGRARRPGRLRDQGRQGGGAQVHRRAETPLSRRQHRRRSLARDPSGDHHPLAAHPEEQQATGVTDDYVRLSIGIEHIDDILADLDQALKAGGLNGAKLGRLLEGGDPASAGKTLAASWRPPTGSAILTEALPAASALSRQDGVRRILDRFSVADFLRQVIGGLRIGPILLGFEETRKAKHDVELLGRRFRGLRVIDQTVQVLTALAVGVDLGQSFGMVAEQFRRLRVFLLRFRRSEPPEGERSLRLMEALVIIERVFGPVELLEDLRDIEISSARRSLPTEDCQARP